MTDVLNVTADYLFVGDGKFDTRNRYISEATASDKTMTVVDGASVEMNLRKQGTFVSYEVLWRWEVGGASLQSNYVRSGYTHPASAWPANFNAPKDIKA